jgi:hypothetical protein
MYVNEYDFPGILYRDKRGREKKWKWREARRGKDGRRLRTKHGNHVL